MTVPFPARGAAERAALQRERILRASRGCFARDGFHAASMAQIAEAAGMSPGLIYRYFDSKSAIVHAIVERQMEEARDTLDRVGSSADLVSGILEVFEQWSRGDAEERSAGLYLEMAALAARDAGLAASMRAADAAVRASLGEALRRSGAGAHAALIQCLIEGLLFRAVLQPDLDRDLLRGSLHAVMQAVGSTG